MGDPRLNAPQHRWLNTWPSPTNVWYHWAMYASILLYVFLNFGFYNYWITYLDLLLSVNLVKFKWELVTIVMLPSTSVRKRCSVFKANSKIVIYIHNVYWLDAYVTGLYDQEIRTQMLYLYVKLHSLMDSCTSTLSSKCQHVRRSQILQCICVMKEHRRCFAYSAFNY